MESIAWAPSTSLPPLAKLSQTDSSTVARALQNLRNLYWPTSKSIPQALTSKSQVRKKRLPPITRIRNEDVVPDSGYASAEGEEDEDEHEEGSDKPNSRLSRTNTSDDVDTDDVIDILRADTLERAFAIKWTTGFVCRSSAWSIIPGSDDTDADARSELVDIASQILSAFSGTEPEDEEEAAITRTFSFALAHPASTTLDVRLNDAALLSEDHTSVGLQSWGSAIILAERICQSPCHFGLGPPGDTNARVLELGAGTGLLSIVAAKLLSNSSTVIATDYHPDVLANLSLNVQTNFPSASSPISVHKLDWENPEYQDPFDKPFNVILAADVVYNRHHAQWIHDCVERLLVKPSAGEEGGAFWLLIPVRPVGRHEGLNLTVDAVFPSAALVSESKVNRWTLAIISKEEIQRRSNGVGRADETGYRLFKIGWVRGDV
ncbi:hypothetical protein ONZ45_g16738 [Pleurotus djamor]|nr:hypothetical protein ONZ45_g16738 [Pleurotus djamor]